VIGIFISPASSMFPNDSLPARGQKVRDQTSVRVSHEWTPMLVAILPALDRTLASRASKVVRRQRRKSLSLQAGVGESSYSVSIRGHDCPSRYAATALCLSQLDNATVPRPAAFTRTAFEAVSASPGDSR
jgi:hypothetical protein